MRKWYLITAATALSLALLTPLVVVVWLKTPLQNVVNYNNTTNRGPSTPSVPHSSPVEKTEKIGKEDQLQNEVGRLQNEGDYKSNNTTNSSEEDPEARLEIGRFAVVIPFTLVHEGGARYTNHPADPGGPTKYGITIHDVQKYLKRNATAEDVKRLTKAQAVRIYKRHYWDKIDADHLPVGLDYTMFDYTVNAGEGRSLPALKRCIVKYDERVVPLIRCVNNDRMEFQMGLGPRYDVFKRGWRNRIESVTRISLNMAAPSLYKAGPPSDLIPRVGTGKAYEENE